MHIIRWIKLRAQETVPKREPVDSDPRHGDALCLFYSNLLSYQNRESDKQNVKLKHKRIIQRSKLHNPAFTPSLNTVPIDPYSVRYSIHTDERRIYPYA